MLTEWSPLSKYFWNLHGKSQVGLPSGHKTYKKLGNIIYIKIGDKIFQSKYGDKSFKELTNALSIICLGN